MTGVPVRASNLPQSMGADTSQTGSLETLLPILELQESIMELKQQHRQQPDTLIRINPKTFPTAESSFKRLLDAYSDPVSYKQKFLDQNAFLVYYSNGFDGPGRPRIEEKLENEKQTLQFGYRNEAWVAWDALLAELAFQSDQDNDVDKYLQETLSALNSYLTLVPKEDMTAALVRRKEQSWLRWE